MRLLSCLMLIVALKLAGADLKTVSGRLYRNVEVMKINAGYVHIEHDKGNAAIALNDLPDNFIAALNTHQRKALQSMADIKLKNNTVYRRCTIDSLGNGFINVVYSKGSAKIHYKDLPDKYLATFTRRQLALLHKVPAPAKKPKPRITATSERTEEGRIVYLGPRGGKFYIDESGKRVYLPKE